MEGGPVRLACWLVQDTGLLPAPARFRRLGGVARHHRGQGDPWPARVELVVEGDDLVVDGVGRWPLAGVELQRVAPGPPPTFVVRVPGAAQLLATADPAGLDALAQVVAAARP
jgi:hypothetical protein